jgi:hypothetical protein
MLSLKKNKHPKFDNNFDIRRKLEHFEYVMIHALNENPYRTGQNKRPIFIEKKSGFVNQDS